MSNDQWLMFNDHFSLIIFHFSLIVVGACPEIGAVSILLPFNEIVAASLPGVHRPDAQSLGAGLEAQELAGVDPDPRTRQSPGASQRAGPGAIGPVSRVELRLRRGGSLFRKSRPCFPKEDGNTCARGRSLPRFSQSRTCRTLFP